MRKKIIVGNWKMNKTHQQTVTYMKIFKELLAESAINENIQFGFASPATNIHHVRDNMVRPDMIVAAQNMHFENFGAFTGEISVGMIKEAGANSVILGHSERRQLFCETDADVNKKVHTALKNEIIPIVCVGETQKERLDGIQMDVIKKQIANSLADVSNWSKVIIAYEPIWAIGTSKTATPADAQEMCAFIRSITDKDVIIQYGGSVNVDNIIDLMEQPDIDGALVGGASLDPKVFIELLSF